MLDENPFFKLLWRINGLILFFAGILSVVVLSFAGYQIFNEVFQARNVSDIVNIDEQQNDIQQVWSFGSNAFVSGSPYLMLALQLEQEYEYVGTFASRDKHTRSTRNYLFINTQNNQEQQWLFDNNQFLVTDYTQLQLEKKQRDYSYTSNAPTIAIFFQTIKQDTNDDNRLSYQDKFVIGLSKPNGQNYQDIITDIDKLLGHKVIDETTLLVLYNQGQNAFSTRIDLNTFEILDKAKLVKPDK